jgi:hypothetical protein
MALKKTFKTLDNALVRHAAAKDKLAAAQAKLDSIVARNRARGVKPPGVSADEDARSIERHERNVIKQAENEPNSDPDEVAELKQMAKESRMKGNPLARLKKAKSKSSSGGDRGSGPVEEMPKAPEGDSSDYRDESFKPSDTAKLHANIAKGMRDRAAHERKKGSDFDPKRAERFDAASKKHAAAAEAHASGGKDAEKLSREAHGATSEAETVEHGKAGTFDYEDEEFWDGLAEGDHATHVAILEGQERAQKDAKAKRSSGADRELEKHLDKHADGVARMKYGSTPEERAAGKEAMKKASAAITKHEDGRDEHIAAAAKHTAASDDFHAKHDYAGGVMEDEHWSGLSQKDVEDAKAKWRVARGHESAAKLHEAAAKNPGDAAKVAAAKQASEHATSAERHVAEAARLSKEHGEGHPVAGRHAMAAAAHARAAENPSDAASKSARTATANAGMRPAREEKDSDLDPERRGSGIIGKPNENASPIGPKAAAAMGMADRLVGAMRDRAKSGESMLNEKGVATVLGGKSQNPLARLAQAKKGAPMSRQASVDFHAAQAKEHAAQARNRNLGAGAQGSHADAAKLHRDAAKKFETGSAAESGQAAAAANKASKSVQTGAKGGQYILTASGSKRYIGGK